MIPNDDLTREIIFAQPDIDETLPHVSVAGDVYTILVSGKQSAGKYALIDMLVPPGGGPPPHRHDFEEMFHILEGTLEFTFREMKLTAGAGETVSIPANAPHCFKNVSSEPARMLCTVSPAGGEDLFLDIGIKVPSRTGPVPELDETMKKEMGIKAKSLAKKYNTEML